MYKFKSGKKDEFLQGRKITYVAKNVGITRVYLTDILNGKSECSKLVAFCIVKVLYPEKEIADYYELIKKGE